MTAAVDNSPACARPWTVAPAGEFPTAPTPRGGTGRLRAREMFVKLSHRPGHAQADFGEADANIAGTKVRFHYFRMDLPHSDDGFVKAYPAETAEAFCDGHVAAFGNFGGVPQSTRVSSLSLVRYRGNDYSVPTRYGHQEVLAKGYVGRVVSHFENLMNEAVSYGRPMPLARPPPAPP